MPARRPLRPSLALAALSTIAAVWAAACSGDAPAPPPVAEAPAPVKPPPPAPPPPATPPPVEAKTLAFQLHPTLGEVCRVLAPKAYFEYDSARLTWGDAVVIDQVVKCLKRDDMRGEALQLIGRASVTGPAKYNRALALERAQAVADGLVAAGLDRSRITLVARGEKGFSAPETPTGLAFQRRVDLQLVDPRPRTVEVTYWDVDDDTRMSAAEFYTQTADLLGINGYDRDEDGGLSPSETAAFVFNAWDANRDKILDGQEWGFGAEGWSRGEKAFGTFERWDENSDRRIEPVEWIDRFVEADVFDEWDLDDDGTLYDHEIALSLFRMYDVNGDGWLVDHEADRIRAWGFGKQG